MTKLSMQEVLAELKANKVRRHNHVGATRRLCGGRPSRNTHTDCGKFVGYCPTCNLNQGEKHLETDCRRCGDRIDRSTVSRHSNPGKRAIWARRAPWGNPDVPAADPIFGFPYLEGE
jgi:hypothetical protein